MKKYFRNNRKNFLIDFLSFLLVAVPGSWLVFEHFKGAVGGWFIREDSRFFSSGIFSFYDLWIAFSTRMNSMGQYRPIIKLLWGLPEWLGYFNAQTYHWLSLSLLLCSGLLLSRFVYQYFPSLFASVWAGILFVLLPVNEKPVYWISAWHNSAVALFSIAACVFRVESWRRFPQAALLRSFSLLFLFLALASREVAFGVTLVLAAIDYIEGKTLRRSIDLLILSSFLFAYLFLIESPLGKAGVKISLDRFLNPLDQLVALWNYGFAVFFAGSDAMANAVPGFGSVFIGTVFCLSVLMPLVQRSFFLGSLLLFLGIAPFLILGSLSVEYASVMALGMIFLTAGAFIFLVHHVPKWVQPLLAFCASFFLLYCFNKGAEARQFYYFSYIKQSQSLEKFVGDFASFSKEQEPFRSILIESISPKVIAELSDTIHFLHPGLDQIIPDRIFLYTPETLGIIDGTGASNPTTPIWSNQMANVIPHIRAIYSDNGFKRLQ